MTQADGMKMHIDFFQQTVIRRIKLYAQMYANSS